ncbi:hypothetical protein CMUS01_12905 [Colletotrichum musicola]|uniref:DUF7587 domain-containing protein n=1 Tax=Colletotrichum musicola TaxID=2175873 RepID=A0A8H6JI85_9PEZI|nr:hypothetical protein CMUS01_12905 [Colletotrichum musicola]
MDAKPSEKMKVARYAPDIIKIEENTRLGVKGWLTRSTTDKNVRWALRVPSEHIEEVETAFPGVLSLMKSSRDVGCVNGTALLSTNWMVKAVSPLIRPEATYRAVHAGHPNDGIRSRLGRGSDPIFFQVHLRKHLRWLCREPSPFLSATPSMDEAIRIDSIYEPKGHLGVKIIVFTTDGPEWNRQVQRIWDARDLLRQLRLVGDDRDYLDHEYLIEDSIPKESILTCYDWKTKKGELDPDGSIQQQTTIELEDKRAKAAEAKKRQKEKKVRAERRLLREARQEKRKADDGDDLQDEDSQQSGNNSEPQKKRHKRSKPGKKYARK